MLIASHAFLTRLIVGSNENDAMQNELQTTVVV